MCFIWLLIIALLILINTVIVNLRIPLEGVIGAAINNGIQIALSGILFLLLLIAWHKLTMYCRERRLKHWRQRAQ
ncbi:MAG: hypothetical protein QFX33_01510 [Candidatus Nezhaarchaeota archaeon]|nr:hypothetical protein [Candidatus Nezhaarchaeota archaeon]